MRKWLATTLLVMVLLVGCVMVPVEVDPVEARVRRIRFEAVAAVVLLNDVEFSRNLLALAEDIEELLSEPLSITDLILHSQHERLSERMKAVLREALEAFIWSYIPPELTTAPIGGENMRYLRALWLGAKEGCEAVIADAED